MPRDKISKCSGMLFVVGTPIGNLEDITLRSLRVLKEADLIAAEDTRHTRKLLSHYDIHVPLVSYHEHNKRSRTPEIISRIKDGSNVALVSDAGMPGISDPGHDLIVRALQEEISVTVVPGPSSLVAALVLSGFPTAQFCFAGFLPKKAGPRERRLQDILAGETTTVLFESPARIPALMKAISRLSPSRQIVIARELTKKFEEVLRGTASELAAHFSRESARGECVVVIHGASSAEGSGVEQSSASPSERVERLMREEGISKKEAMRKVAQEFNISRREVYRQLLEETSPEQG